MVEILTGRKCHRCDKEVGREMMISAEGNYYCQECGEKKFPDRNFDIALNKLTCRSNRFRRC